MTIPLVETRRRTAQTATIAKMVNGLPAKSTRHRICSMVISPMYEVVFSYAGGKIATVQVSAACRTVARGEVVKDLTDLDGLLGNWST